MTLSRTSKLSFFIESIQIAALRNLVIGFNFRKSQRNFLFLWVYNYKKKKKKINKNLSLLSIIYITFETHSLSPDSQRFWPGFVFSKSSAAVLVPTVFICFYIFNIAEMHVKWINPDAGRFAALHNLSWVFFLCTLTRFDIQLMFLLERKLICGCLDGLNIKKSAWHRRVSSPQGRKSVIPPAWGRWVMQGYENFWRSLPDHHPALASAPGRWWKRLLFTLQM